MATKKLSRNDDQFINDLISDKQAFFFKEKPKKSFDAGRGGRAKLQSARIGVGLGFARGFVGLYVTVGSSEHRLGYTKL